MFKKHATGPGGAYTISNYLAFRVPNWQRN